MIVEILPGRLYMGNAENHVKLLSDEYRVNHIVDLRIESNSPYYLKTLVTHYPLHDSGKTKPEQLREVVKIIHEMIQTGKMSIFVHCVAGRSRSVVVVALYLYRYKYFSTLRKALDFVRDKRYRGKKVSSGININLMKVVEKTLSIL